MPFVTNKRWAARKGDTKGIDRVDSAPTAIVDAWGVPFIKSWIDGDRNDVKTTDNGKRFVIDASTVLIWEHVAPSGSDFELGGIKETLLVEKAPAVPRWRTRVDCPAGVVVAYQPELTPEEIADGCIRPDHVVGSYAVFDATGAKVGHLYRPFAVDANGKKMWLDMRITPDPQSGQPIQQGTITVTGAAAWFAAAKYPVTIDPTFGYTSVGGTGTAPGGNTQFTAGPFSPASDGNATAVSSYYGISYNPDSTTLGIWANGATTPTTLLGDGDGGSITTGYSGWISDTLDSPVAVVSGTSYWLGRNEILGRQAYYDAYSGRYRKQHSETYSDGTLSNWGTTSYTHSNAIYSFYAEYTEAASGPTEGEIMAAAGPQIFTPGRRRFVPVPYR